MFGARDLAASSAEFRLVSQLSFGFGAGGDGADDLDDLDVPVTEPSEEEALDLFAREIDQELDGAPHEAPSLPTADARAAPRLTLGAARQLGIGPFAPPAAAAPSTAPPELSARTKPYALAQRRCCGSGQHACCAAPKRQALDAYEAVAPSSSSPSNFCL